ncbi:hypothetical protein J6590_040323 [Homalodisca vitripennis]|nr:hypothetical protein J6590_040323 [Homalodisca vitripennis]
MEVLGHTFIFLAMLIVEAIAYPKGSIYRCQHSSPQLNDCVREGLASVISQFRAGNVELGVPPLEPIEVPYLQIRHDDPNLSVDLVMKNINIFGFTDIKLAKVT